MQVTLKRFSPWCSKAAALCWAAQADEHLVTWAAARWYFTGTSHQCTTQVTGEGHLEALIVCFRDRLYQSLHCHGDQMLLANSTSPRTLSRCGQRAHLLPVDDLSQAHVADTSEQAQVYGC
jgi:hypothetical protein